MKCKRCREEFLPPDDKTNICGNCADDLRAEEEAYDMQQRAADETEAYAKYQTEEQERYEQERILGIKD